MTKGTLMMTSRIVTLCLFLGACSTAASTPDTAQTPTLSTPAPAQTSPLVSEAPYEAWKRSFIDKAVARGFERGFVELQLRDVVPQASVLRADTSQPEFSRPVSVYIRNAVSQGRIDGGRTRLAANAHVPTIENAYGVPAAILGGIWGMESDFGRVQGDIDVVTAFATLAFDGRRRDWAETQLLYTLTAIRDGKATRERLKGSWAGAMGQTQFLPENYLKLAVDGDNDGVIDIWASESDSLASAANLLSKAGWQRGQAWAVEVTLPTDFDYYLAETESQTPVWWAERGIIRADGAAWTEGEKAVNATLILPAGAKGPAFLALPNHYVIRKYNNSTAYALAVGFIADGIAGKPALKTPWPTEQPLSLDQRKNTQMALNALGFNAGTVDGVVGVGTRKALREWQKANGRPADGYLTPELADELRLKIPAGY
ncbi:MAG: lytic murein transglycosylase [Asticcacaulis sp.]